ncbi:excisionase [Burkholderia sp. JKS000303]|uniref:excisionase n=1 Tax=Burkholderia sp. JKS000303 TaxID=1938747 RepID=UPI000BFA1568|nr:excisionase [Burkholderia sp. JKS000303]PFH29078.1 excisionase-like protein [Burkholderia sp. JKS000303]
MAAQLIPIATWAERVFGEHAPHRNTLLNWIHAGRIHPSPRKIGRGYFCQPEAEYVEPGRERVRRLVNGR